MNLFKGLLRNVALVMLGVALTAGALRAAAPTAPKNLKAATTISVVNGIKKSVIVLTWQSGTGERDPKNYLGFKIYGGKLEANNITFTQLGIVDSNTFTFTVNMLTTAGTYKFYVAAYNNDGASNTDQISVTYNPADTGNTGGGDAIKFTTELVKTGKVNVPYVYDANAMANITGVIRFALMTGPQGMTIDSGTGIVSWTPTVAGTYSVGIKAFLALDPTKYALQTGTITISGADTGNGGGDAVRITSEFVKVGTVNTPYNYTVKAVAANNTSAVHFAIVTGPNGMTIDSITGVITWTPLQNGSYEVTIKAYLATDPTKYALQKGVIVVGPANNGGGDAIKFSSTPITRATLNKPYSYDANAVAANGGVVHFSFAALGTPIPSGMTIDSVTGIVSWTPSTAPMTVFVAIRAYLASNPTVSATQTYTITVWKCEKPIIITGEVRDQNGNLATGSEKLIVTAHIANRNDGFSAPVKEGRYRLELDEGDYVVSADLNIEVTRSTETKVSVKCGDSVVVNVTIERSVTLVGGKVTRASNGTPVGNALVEFYGYERLDTLHQKVVATVSARTNNDGNYQVTLANRYVYIAKATPPNDSLTVLYFNNVTNPANATVIAVSGTPRTDVNFALGSRQAYTNSISGTVHDSLGNGVPAIVTAYRLPSPNSKDEPHASVTVRTDSLGHFTINNLVPGTYVLQIRPIEKPTLAAGYYRLNAPLVISWKDATTLSVDANTTISGLDVLVPNTKKKGGINRLIGSVGNSGGIASKHGSEIQSAALPVGDALVAIVDDANAVNGYTFSNDNGDFELTELAPGTYHLVADMVGFATNVSTITITDAQPLTSITVTLNGAVSGVDDARQNTLHLSSTPNPATTTATLHFMATTAGARLSVLDATGTEVWTATLPIGTSAYTLNASTLPTGTYFVRLQSGVDGGLVRIVVVR